MCIHPGIERLSHVLLKHIGCHRHDRNRFAILTSGFPDLSGRRQSVHDRHPDIHQDDVVISGLMGKEMRHALLSVDRHIHLQILVQQDIARDLNVDLIVLDQQRSFAGKIVVGRLYIALSPQLFSGISDTL